MRRGSKVRKLRREIEIRERNASKRAKRADSVNEGRATRRRTRGDIREPGDKVAALDGKAKGGIFVSIDSRGSRGARKRACSGRIRSLPVMAFKAEAKLREGRGKR